MKTNEALPRPQEAKFAANLSSRVEEPKGYHIRGDVFMELRDAVSGDLIERREHRNLVVKDASILIARLVKNNQEAPTLGVPFHGAFCLAVGTGDVGWNVLNPPAATNTQRALYAELTRKTFATTTFIDAGGAPTAIPTNVVDFQTTFSESEAVGALCEMGILGGNVSTNLLVKNPVSPPNGPYNPLVDLTTKETLCNYLTFGVITKPPTSTLSITWRLSF